MVDHNMLDKVIGYFAPTVAYQREAARTKMALMGAWKGASRTRAELAGWNPSAGYGADEDNKYDLAILRARSRDLVRSSPIARGIIDTICTGAVGTGLSVDPTPDLKSLGLSDEQGTEWANDTREKFARWAESKDCDISRSQTFYECQDLVKRSELESGDVFINLPRIKRNQLSTLALQIIEADRVSNPDNQQDTAALSQGIEKDQYGAPRIYHVADNYVAMKASSWAPIPTFTKSGRRAALHLFKRLRPGQTRGVPLLAGVMQQLKQLDRYSDAELQAAVISGAFSMFVKMDAEAFGSIFNDSSEEYLSAAKGWDGAIPTGSLNGPGNVVNLLPGEEIQSVNPGRPNAQFDPFVASIYKQLGMGTRLPVEVLTKHFQSSYSAARAAMLDAQKTYRSEREQLAVGFCQPVYEAWLDDAVASGLVAAPGYFSSIETRTAWLKAEWVGDGPGSIDPSKEVAAARERVNMGISTIAAESIALDGISWDIKHRQRVKERQLRLESNLEGAFQSEHIA